VSGVGSVGPADVGFLVEAQRRSQARASGGQRASWPEDALLDAAAIVALIDRARYGVLATAGATGRPQAAPISYVVARDRLWFATVRGARLRNCRENPWGSFVLTSDDPDADGARRHVALRVEGPVAVHDRASLDTLAPEFAARWRERNETDAEWAAAFLELTADVVYSYGA
jgi:hypothetical protein